VRILLLISCLLAALPGWSAEPAPASIHSFWIWNHVDSFPKRDVLALQPLGIDRLYHHLHELHPDGTWKEIRSFLPEHFEIPHRYSVVRIAPDPKWIDDPKGIAEIPQLPTPPHLRTTRKTPGLQIDFDCPASRLADYAAAITRLRETGKFPSISVTALASWIDAPDFPKLAAVVDEIVPMFYDLEPDTPTAVQSGNFQPMIGADTLRWIEKWKNCPQDWRAGLPNFQRLSIFAQDGSLVGHHPRFSPDSLLDHPLLDRQSPNLGPVTVFDVIHSGTLSNRKIEPGQILVLRRPDDELLRSAVTTSMNSGARGIVWFAHPSSAPTPWRSLPHLCQFQPDMDPLAKPVIQVYLDEAGVILVTNPGPTDIGPRPDGQPWKITLQAAPGSFGRSHSGDFSSLEAIGGSTHRLELAQGIRLGFHSLPAGKQLRSGPRLALTSTVPPWSLDPTP
jgi:hypothetical protein